MEIFRGDLERLSAITTCASSDDIGTHRKSTQFPILIVSPGIGWKESRKKDGPSGATKYNQKSQLVSESR